MSYSSFNQAIPQITVKELAAQMNQAEQAEQTEKIQFIDVREPDEVEIASIDGFINLPLSQFAEWSGQIQVQFDPTVETIVLCHHGVRSAQMCQWLQQQGFTHVKNVTGGIEAYAIAVDSTIPRY